MKHILNAGLALIWAAFFATPLFAFELPGDATPEETAAYEVLNKYCARCHQEGALKEGLPKPKSGFGHVLDLRRLANDPKFVKQGDAMNSPLHYVIGSLGFPPMPDDCTKPECFPSDAELETLALWIDSLGEEQAEAREFVSYEMLHQAALADLQTLPSNRLDRVRYLSLRNLNNDMTINDENYQGYLGATIKLLNALSFNPTIFRHQQVDDNNVLIRIFLPDLDWDYDTWSLLEGLYPYGVTSDTDLALKQLQTLTGTALPIIRADWFAATASVSPLYYDILGLPDTVQGLEAMLGLDMNKNIRNEQVVRAGFQKSGVSTNNRLIERHALGTGFFWTSYDFAGSKGRQSFFEYPLGPNTAYPPALSFEHDGGESIFTLPNGFHAYYLNTADGARLDVGPTSIVRDDDYTDGTGEVVNGISCISCHSKGIRFNEDKVRDAAMSNLAFSARTRQTIDAIYPGQEEVSRLMTQDMEAFFATLRAAGLDPEAGAGGLEPVRGLFVYFVDGFIDMPRAASELGMTVEELQARAGFVGVDLAGLLNRMNMSPIARDEWTAVFPRFLERVTDYTPIEPGFQLFDKDALSYSVQKVIETDEKPDAKKKPLAYDPKTQTKVTQTTLTIYSDKPRYRVGDGIRFVIEPKYDCRLTLINIDDDGDSCVLYPHPGLPDDTILGGSQYIFPPRGSLRAAEVGFETVLAICNASKEAVSYATRDTSKVSCDASQRKDTARVQNKDVYETFVFSLDPDEKTSNTGADYRVLSKQNTEIEKARIVVPVDH